MASDAELRNAGITITYTWDLQSCTVRMNHPCGLDATAAAENRFSARAMALEELRGQWQQRKVRRLIRAFSLSDDDERDLLMACGLLPYDHKRQTNFVPRGPVVTGYRRP
jgi:hypothetical protein